MYSHIAVLTQPDGRTDKPSATPKVGMVYMTVHEVSTARDRYRDSFYYSSGNGTGTLAGKNNDYGDTWRSDPITYNDSEIYGEDSG